MSDNLRVAYGNDRLEPLNVQRFAAGSFTVQGTGTEVLLILQNASPIIDRSTNTISDQLVLEPVAFVSISLATAKDLLVLLGQVVDNHERAVGPITTPFTVQREGPERAQRATEVALDQFRRA